MFLPIEVLKSEISVSLTSQNIKNIYICIGNKEQEKFLRQNLSLTKLDLINLITYDLNLKLFYYD